MEADVPVWRKELNCHIVYPAASSSANNQLTTGLIHPPSQHADSSWQLISLHTEKESTSEQQRRQWDQKCCNRTPQSLITECHPQVQYAQRGTQPEQFEAPLHPVNWHKPGVAIFSC